LLVTDDYIFEGGMKKAEYVIVDHYTMGESKIGFTEEFMSTSVFYDSDTHEKLGDYLRLLRSMYGIDLMPLYNCFSNYYVDNIDISSGNLQPLTNSGYRVAMVPVKFNKKYTISMNCAAGVFIKPVIYRGRLLKNSADEFIYDNINPKVYKYGYMSYSSPIEFDTYNADEESQLMENYLYLAIQFPKSTNTKITVIEGEVKLQNTSVVYDSVAMKNLSNHDINKIFRSAPSLLDTTFGTTDSSSIPFSDRLIEYLLQHTIDCRETIMENVERVMDKFNYPSGASHMWTQQLRGSLFNSYMNLKHKMPDLTFTDILGYVDKDIESAIDRECVKYKL
jgi:hypothetical protein